MKAAKSGVDTVGLEREVIQLRCKPQNVTNETIEKLILTSILTHNQRLSCAGMLQNAVLALILGAQTAFQYFCWSQAPNSTAPNREKQPGTGEGRHVQDRLCGDSSPAPWASPSSLIVPVFLPAPSTTP